MGVRLTAVLLDTHVLYWWSIDSPQLSKPAIRTLATADRLEVAGVTWYELAWLAARGRIEVDPPVREWLAELSNFVVTTPITPAVAAAAAELPTSFPGDPADRMIYASAIVTGTRLVTKDRRIRAHDRVRKLTVW